MSYTEATDLWSEASMTEEELRAQVFQLVGQATTCWDNLGGAGTFQPERAKQVAENILTLMYQFADEQIVKTLERTQ